MGDAPQPIKRSLFTRPLFKRPAGLRGTFADFGATNLFSRSNSSYQAVVEDEERRLEKRAAKAARRAQVLSERDTTRVGEKRQRSLSTSASSSEEESETERKSSQTRSSPYSPPQAKDESQSHRTTDQESQETIQASKPAEEDDEDDIVITSMTLRRQAPPQSPIDPSESEDEVESDDEFAELARQARDDARFKTECSKIATLNATHSFQRDVSVSKNYADELQVKEESASAFFEIFSALPGVETQRFKGPLDKGMRRLRIAWCKRNGFTEEEAGHIILMFRGKRVFDVNTPESLGIMVDEEGNGRVKDNDPTVVNEGNILIEAINEQDLESYIRTYNQRRGTNQSAIFGEHPDDHAEGETPKAAHEPRSIKIICRARGLKDFKVLVKNNSTIARLQWAFIMNHKLSENTIVNVMLDGEVLHPYSVMDALGIEDMDVFDVQVKSPV